MASQSGTATGMEDLLTRIIDFLANDSALNATVPSQAWTVLRERRDNLANVSSDFSPSSPGSPTHRKLHHIMRQEARSLNLDSETGNASYFSASSTSGQNIDMELREARAPVTLRLKAPTGQTGMPRDFRLQHSNDGVSWTTALTVTGQDDWGYREARDFAITSTANRLHWRFILDARVNTTTALWIEELQLIEADGSVSNHFGSEVIFRAPGLAGTDTIYTGIRTEYDVTSGWYNFFLNGFQGYDPLESFFKMPGALTRWGQSSAVSVPMVPLWDQAMSYNLRASGRSFTFQAKVSSNYEGGYLGLLKSYSPPSKYPYPLIVGGSLIPNSSDRSSPWRYSNSDVRHSLFFNPATNSNPNSSSLQWATMYLLHPDGVWNSYGNKNITSPTSNFGVINLTVSSSPPVYDLGGTVRGVYPNLAFSAGRNLPYRECLGGGYLPLPFTLVSRLPSFEVYGELEGVVYISGFNNSSEDTTTIDGVPYLLFQNSFRSQAWEYAAIAQD